jgi:nitrate/nitrite transport system substrate-binding protein
MTQHKRWGLLKGEVDYLGTATAVNQIAIYKDAAAMAKVSVPKAPMRTTKLIDGTVWDGKNPKAYADAFKIKV